MKITFKAPILGLCLVIALLGTWQSLANYYSLKATYIVRDLAETKHVTPGEIFQAQHNLIRCLEINPYHPTCRQSLAQTHLSLATGYGLTGARAGVGLVYLNMAKDTYLQSLNQSPVNSLAWYRIARIEAYQGNPQSAITALANSILTGPSEPNLAAQRVPLMLSLLSQADTENQNLFTSNILRHWQSTPYWIVNELRQNPSIQPEFAKILNNTLEVRELWKHRLKTPFPLPAPLGDSRKKE